MHIRTKKTKVQRAYSLDRSDRKWTFWVRCEIIFHYTPPLKQHLHNIYKVLSVKGIFIVLYIQYGIGKLWSLIFHYQLIPLRFCVYMYGKFSFSNHFTQLHYNSLVSMSLYFGLIHAIHENSDNTADGLLFLYIYKM